MNIRKIRRIRKYLTYEADKKVSAVYNDSTS